MAIKIDIQSFGQGRTLYSEEVANAAAVVATLTTNVYPAGTIQYIRDNVALGSPVADFNATLASVATYTWQVEVNGELVANMVLTLTNTAETMIQKIQAHKPTYTTVSLSSKSVAALSQVLADLVAVQTHDALYQTIGPI